MLNRSSHSIGQGRLPDFLIIGAKKAGTTAIGRYLEAHPEVFMTPRMEVHFFDKNYDKGLDWYRERFSGATSERALGEATPDYLNNPEAVSRMGRSLPHVRLIAVLRDPVARAYSHYWMHRSRGRTSLEFREAIESFPAYLERGRYLQQLVQVCEIYPRESLLVQIFEKAMADPVERYRETCRFLQVDDRVIPSIVGRRIGPYTTFRSLRVRDRANRLIRDGSPIKRTAGKVMARLNNSRNASYPPMDDALRADLEARFAEDNAALARWLGQDLSIWSTHMDGPVVIADAVDSTN